jgi:4-amino-4-deoxy-L-arabinose transferase-like glycosyltransferase
VRAWPLLITIAAVAAVRVAGIDALQTDLYGDIQIVHQYVSDVRSGSWPFAFALSAGPLYHYLVAPLTLVTGMSYTGLKLASVVVSGGVLAVTYLLAYRLADRALALLALAVAGTSSWLLIFSRLGNSQILVPLLSTGSLWLAVRFVQERRRQDLWCAAVLSTLGLYTYPQSFVLPIVTLVVLVIAGRTTGRPLGGAAMAQYALICLLLALPFAWLAVRDNAAYITSKAATDKPLVALARNTRAALLAFHVRGDGTFRSNVTFVGPDGRPQGVPHLDPISGVLLVAGIAVWLRPTDRQWSPVLLVPLVLLQVPSVLVLAQPQEVPSASRTLGAAPIAYILVATGILGGARSLSRRGWRRAAIAATVGALALVGTINLNRYFVDYIQALPYRDTSIGREIAAYAGALPQDVAIHLVGCCWEYSMPELQFVRLVMPEPERLHGVEPQQLTCEHLRRLERPAVLIWSFHDPLPAPQLATCADGLRVERHASARGLPVFHSAWLGK